MTPTKRQLIERTTRTSKHETVADLLEMQGLVFLADALRADPTLPVRFTSDQSKKQSNVDDIIVQNPDIPRTVIERAVHMRSRAVSIMVGDFKAAIDEETAAELNRVLHT